MINKILYFSGGAVVGAAAMWLLLKKKYDDELEQRTQSVIRAFTEQANRNAKNSLDDPSIEPDKTELADTPDNEKDIMRNAGDLSKRPRVDYTAYGRTDDAPTETKIASEPTVSETHIIAPIDFGEIEDYVQIQMTQFYDGVLTDDDFNMIDPADLEKWLGGIDPMNHYGEYEDDAVHIRNDSMKCYIEIVKDERLFAAIMAERNR